MQSVLAQLDEKERNALAAKYLAVRMSQPEPTFPQDGFLFVYDLVDRKGRLTDAGTEVARSLARTHEVAQTPLEETLVENPAQAPLDLVAAVRALAERAGGLSTLRCILNSLTD